MKNIKLKQAIYGFIGVLVIIFLWSLISFFINDISFVPSPTETVRRFPRLLLEPSFYLDIWMTLERTLLGLFIGLSLGVFIGVIVGTYRRIYQGAQFSIDFFRSIPSSALFPIFIIFFGLGDLTKILITAWASSLVVLFNTVYGIRSLSQEKINLIKTYKLPFWRALRSITLPNALPYIAIGLRQGLSFGLIVEIVAEMFLGSNSGLGHRIYDSSSILQMDEAFASIVTIGLIGYFLNKLIIVAQKKIIHWKTI